MQSFTIPASHQLAPERLLRGNGMRFHATTVGLALISVFAVLAATDAFKRDPDLLASSPYSVFKVETGDGMSATSHGGGGSAGPIFVPIYRVDDPETMKTGKHRTQNACDKCSLCLAKTGNLAERKTLDNIYQNGTYAYATAPQKPVDRCLASRSCKACQVKAMTFTLPETALLGDELVRIFAAGAFPPQSYLLSVKSDITMTQNRTQSDWAGDVAVLIGKPGQTYDRVYGGNEWLAQVAAYYSVYTGFYIAAQGSDGCYLSGAPQTCTLSVRQPLCTRYTYAAASEDYPLPTMVDYFYDSYNVFTPIPTMCFPVTEFDLSKSAIYLGNTYLYEDVLEDETIRGDATFRGSITIYYAGASHK